MPMYRILNVPRRLYSQNKLPSINEAASEKAVYRDCWLTIVINDAYTQSVFS